MGGTCKQGPNHVTGELPTKPSKRKFGSAYKDLHPTQIYKDLHPTWIYKTHQITGHTPNNIQAMLIPRVSSPTNGQASYTTTSVTHPSVPGSKSAQFQQ